MWHVRTTPQTYKPLLVIHHKSEENHARYLVCFGAFHVRHVAPTLIVIRTLIFFIILVYTLVTTSNDLLKICTVLKLLRRRKIAKRQPQ
ncbi:hypothetical protein KIN20_033404 [Parelaphostrongylus tenuis]|uniref:Uncharacterized protein n=1 Tax=Parelaphostrongylus tenuis TaxID=148309 RepID=A0AAD5WIR9_PARTN|nr:hypothetical protein KIN20_033404 [Parelaphostrongylus tenuis]